MIQSLKIRNFKNLSGLNIPKLSRINLISGKNNVGKSSLLEAIGVYIDDSELLNVVEERGEYPKYINRDTNYLKSNEEAIASIFANRNTSVTSDNIIEISDNEDILLLRFVYYTELETEENGNIVRKAIVLDSKDDLVTEEAHLALEIVRQGKNKALIPLERRLDRIRFGRTKRMDFTPVIRINPEFNDNIFIGKLWDNVTLTEKEEYVNFGDGCQIKLPEKPINCSRLGYFDELEEECWHLVKQYCATFGIEFMPQEDGEAPISFDIAKGIQDYILEQFEDAGVRFNFEAQETDEAEDPAQSM